MSNSSIPKIGALEKFGFGAFSASNNIVYLFKSMYYLFFLTNVVGVDVYVAGTILTIGTIWDAVNDPLVGFWAVNHKFKSGERCRPLALWFSLPWAITVVALFVNFGVPMFAKVVLALFVYLVFELFNTLVGIPYNSMGGLATNVDSERRSINAARNFGACAGSGLGAAACMPLLKLFGALDVKGNLNDNAAHGFLLTACVMGTLVVVGCLLHYFTTAERVKPIAGASGCIEEKLSARAAIKMLLHCKSWILNTAYYICYGVTNLLLLSSITYYATYILGSTAASTLIQAAYLVTSIVTTLLIGTLDRALGRKRFMIIAILVSIAGRIWFIADPFNVFSVYVCSITVGFSVSVAYVMLNTNRNNIVDLIEWKEGRRIDSLVSMADGLAGKLASAGATQFIAISMSLSGFDASLPQQPESAINTIISLIGWVPSIVSVVMLAVVLLFNIENELKQMRAVTQKSNC